MKPSENNYILKNLLVHNQYCFFSDFRSRQEYRKAPDNIEHFIKIIVNKCNPNCLWGLQRKGHRSHRRDLQSGSRIPPRPVIAGYNS